MKCFYRNNPCTQQTRTLFPSFQDSFTFISVLILIASFQWSNQWHTSKVQASHMPSPAAQHLECWWWNWEAVAWMARWPSWEVIFRCIKLHLKCVPPFPDLPWSPSPGSQLSFGQPILTICGSIQINISIPAFLLITSPLPYAGDSSCPPSLRCYFSAFTWLPNHYASSSCLLWYLSPNPPQTPQHVSSHGFWITSTVLVAVSGEKS